MIEIRNALVSSTTLGYEDHGILTAFLNLDYGGGSHQSFGGHVLTDKYLAIFVTRVLDTLGVRSWESVKGSMVRVEIRDRLIYRIGHVLEDRWFCPKEEWANGL